MLTFAFRSILHQQISPQDIIDPEWLRESQQRESRNLLEARMENWLQYNKIRAVLMFPWHERQSSREGGIRVEGITKGEGEREGGAM